VVAGNRVARMLATERPELVRGVVSIAAGGKVVPKPEVFESLRTVIKIYRLNAAPMLYAPNYKYVDPRA
jgi:hypothetical protein